MGEWVGYRALLLAVLPFVIGGSLWFLSTNAGGWDELVFLLLLIISIPALAGMAAASSVLAFRKGDGVRKLERTSKAASIFSLTVFGGLLLACAAGAIQSLWF